MGFLRVAYLVISILKPKVLSMIRLRAFALFYSTKLFYISGTGGVGDSPVSTRGLVTGPVMSDEAVNVF